MKSAPTVLLVAVAAVLATTSSERYQSSVPLSPTCQELCVGPGCHQEPEPEECGTLGYTTVCGIRVCYKGPDEVCGKPYNKYGLCAQNLHCNHGTSKGKCTGCMYMNGVRNCSLWAHHHYRY